ncbi:MAG: superoxide dismutase family protein [Clostridiales bacterium]|nr:superoxide dismutase family protein [Clostridiales bacterium]
MYSSTPADIFLRLLNRGEPDAIAWIQGNASWPQLAGSVKFYKTSYGGILLETEIFGLPNISVPGSSDFYAMHIHESGNCARPFDQTGGHYNPHIMPHPQHAGDLPPLLGNQGYAYQVSYDKRFTLEEIVGRSVIIHRRPDDFVSQPSGNSGDKIGCGTIRFMVH